MFPTFRQIKNCFCDTDISKLVAYILEFTAKIFNEAANISELTAVKTVDLTAETIQTV